ncbi:MAG TPA: phosphoadenylyl-sulfate reductase [Mycobacteriales bacterium]|nr:phosphoadenylyl-sulfate reductase [Mycobacteriales bacterium]
MSAPESEHPRLAALARRAGEELEGAHPTEVLRFAATEFGDRFCVTSSMADAVLAHLASTVRPGAHVVFLDTGYHFAETIGTRDAVAATLPVNLITVTPEHTVAEQDAAHGPRLYERDPDRCCAMRKVEPLARALAPYHAWASGLRRDEAVTRRDVPVVEWDARRGMVKVNPLACWRQDDVDAYAAEHGVLVNPLVQLGYASVGCAPCTRPVSDGEEQRAGRWAGTAKTECGLHT